MSGEGMSSTDSEKGSKLPWYKSLRIEGRFPKEQLVVILGGYNAGYTMRYFKPSIRWLMIAKDNVWSPKKFSDDKTISMRELYHVSEQSFPQAIILTCWITSGNR